MKKLLIILLAFQTVFSMNLSQNAGAEYIPHLPQERLLLQNEISQNSVTFAAARHHHFVMRSLEEYAIGIIACLDPECQETFKNKKDALNHFVSRHRNFQSIPSASATLENIYGDKNYQCLLCNTDYPSFIKLKKHYISLHCPAMIESDLEIQQKPEIYVNEPRCRAPWALAFTCQKKAYQENTFCISCNKNFTNRRGFELHIARRHTVRDEQDFFFCDEDNCTSKYTTKEALNVHQLREHQDKNFSCHICGKPFALECDLRQHLIRVLHKKTHRG